MKLEINAKGQFIYNVSNDSHETTIFAQTCPRCLWHASRYAYKCNPRTQIADRSAANGTDVPSKLIGNVKCMRVDAILSPYFLFFFARTWLLLPASWVKRFPFFSMATVTLTFDIRREGAFLMAIDNANVIE